MRGPDACRWSRDSSTRLIISLISVSLKRIECPPLWRMGIAGMGLITMNALCHFPLMGPISGASLAGAGIGRLGFAARAGLCGNE